MRKPENVDDLSASLDVTVPSRAFRRTHTRSSWAHSVTPNSSWLISSVQSSVGCGTQQLPSGQTSVAYWPYVARVTLMVWLSGHCSSAPHLPNPGRLRLLYVPDKNKRQGL